jgi:DNA primase
MAKKILGDTSYFENDGDIIDRIAGEQSRQPLDIMAVVDHFHKRLLASKKALAWLKQHGIDTPEIVNRFKIGYSDGSLVDKSGTVQRTQLQAVGLLTEDDREQFSGCLVIPAFNDSKPLMLYGLDISTSDYKPSVVLKDDQHGIFNYKAIKVYDDVILTDDVLVCLQLVSLGFENSIAVPDKERSGRAIETLRSNRVKTIAIAFDADPLSCKAAELLADVLVGDDFTVKIVFPPEQHTQWDDYLLTGVERDAINNLLEQTPLIAPEPVQDGFSVQKKAGRTVFTCGDLTYQIMGLKETSISSQRVDVRAVYSGHSFPDRVDLYSSRSRRGYAETLSRAFGLEPARIEKDLLRIVDWLEAERDRALTDDGDDGPVELTADERRMGLEFLQRTDLFEQIITDMETLGYVGEDVNKQLLYLAATSRKLDDPVSVIILSQSGSGKSYLVSTVKKLMPPEEVVSVTSLSDQALNYMTDGALEHKFLVLGEAVHSETIEHQIREMLSEHELTRLVTVKDEKSGEYVTRQVRTRTVVASVMSTTSGSVNPENASRCFLINTDESREQTQRIHEQQRGKYTLDRYRMKERAVPAVIARHHAAQRLLRKIVIINPLARYLDFPDVSMRTRRDHERFLDLIASVCFLRQYQKEVQWDGDTEYVECDLTDYRIAYIIMVEGVLSSTLVDLPKGAVLLYESIREMVEDMAAQRSVDPETVTFIQRDVREYTKQGADTIRKYLKTLVSFEYLHLASGRTKGTRHSYRLLRNEPIARFDVSAIPNPDAFSDSLKTTKSSER